MSFLKFIQKQILKIVVEVAETDLAVKIWEALLTREVVQEAAICSWGGDKAQEEVKEDKVGSCVHISFSL